MTKETNSILVLTSLLLIGALTACLNFDKKTNAPTNYDKVKIQTPPPPKRDTNPTINADSTNVFLVETNKINVSKNAKRPFDKLNYDKVIAYDYAGGKGEGAIDIITDGKLAPTITQQKELTQSQVDGLTNYLGAKSTYGGGKALCFNPHLGIVFYKDNKIVEYFSICLECNYMTSSIKIPVIEDRKVKIGDDYEYLESGFSKIGRQKINTLCKQLNFNHCADKLNSMFDE